nr:MAG TPA: hypothetical protein [Caudoviricetes sp.]
MTTPSSKLNGYCSRLARSLTYWKKESLRQASAEGAQHILPSKVKMHESE